jgi:hypothetical protein
MGPGLCPGRAAGDPANGDLKKCHSLLKKTKMSTDNLDFKTTMNQEDITHIRSMLPTMSNHGTHNSDEIVLKHFIATKAMYMALKRMQADTKMNYKKILESFGYKFEYTHQRANMIEIIAHGFMVYMQNNLGHDACAYEAKCPETIEEWYYEIARLLHGEEYSPDTLNAITSCCFVEGEITEMPATFAQMIDGRFDPDVAINLFIIDNLENIENSLSTLVIQQIDGKIKEYTIKINKPDTHISRNIKEDN